MEKKYNKTQLNPDKEFNRHIYHRDQFAHYFRWTYILKIAKIGMKILDLGCGTGNLLEVLYRNKYKADKYLGVDIRKKTIENAENRFKNIPWADFLCADLCIETCQNSTETWLESTKNEKYSIVSCFEVLEHVGHSRAIFLLDNIKYITNENTTVLISTPCYDKKIGAANNHMISGNVGEFTFDEIKKLLSDRFVIENVWGTFASQKDYKNHMNEWQKTMFYKLNEYYDTNLLSNLIAPFFPQYSRNCLWKLRMK